ncbi:uncharacterized protein LOC114131969 [Aphis gossypii]|uniref:uncharacterized protein LOC114131969 n=1 Tax=Aphis gossypii TaxID=80765 RepID=UPI0021598AD0|nr:uncharacterized protein LOC114131969 [Aphis gossypii]
MDDPVLSKLSSLSAKNALSINYHDSHPSLVPLISIMSRIVPEDNLQLIQKIDDQWRSLPLKMIHMPESITNLQYANESPDIFWSSIKDYNLKTEAIGQELPDFALSVLCLPHSNADCERIFSSVNAIKTKYRNKLVTETINGTILTKECVKGGRSQTKNCVNFVPSKLMINRMTSNTLYPKKEIPSDNITTDIFYSTDE